VRKRTASSTSRKVRPWSFVVHECASALYMRGRGRTRGWTKSVIG
jgi:hypothetical protein